MKTLGIIGGLGPETTAEFYSYISYHPKVTKQLKRPHILISSVPIYKKHEQAGVNGKAPKDLKNLLINEAQRLEQAGAELIVMPCNSLHVFENDLKNTVPDKFISIIDATTEFIKQQNIKYIGVLSTALTAKNKLYENALQNIGINVISVPPYMQVKLNKTVLNLINNSANIKDIKTLNTALDFLYNNRAQAILLGCTDLQLIAPRKYKIPIFDTMKILGDKVVEEMVG